MALRIAHAAVVEAQHRIAVLAKRPRPQGELPVAARAVLRATAHHEYDTAAQRPLGLVKDADQRLGLAVER